MKNYFQTGMAAAAVAALMVVGSGCATKKHVAKVVAPIDGRLGTVEQKTTQNTGAIGELETGVSKANERATDAGRRADSANDAAMRADERAGKAGDLANQAGQRADGAQQSADKSMARANEIFENLDNYQLVGTHSVLFDFNKSALNKDGTAKLDEIAASMNGMRRYVVEVQGFTDRTGDPNYNLELSRKRAQTVVHYLTVKQSVPLRRIHLLGVGADLPAADNKTRDGRKQNRRVELKVYMLSDQKAEARPSETRTSSEGNN